MSEMNDHPQLGAQPAQAALVSVCRQLLAAAEAGTLRGLAGVQVMGQGSFAPFTFNPGSFPMEYYIGAQLIASQFLDVWKMQLAAQMQAAAAQGGGLVRAHEGDLSTLDALFKRRNS
jgi:hypothetical protein